ncbi:MULTISPECIES: papain-like cysteine protease family protein [Streptomyces]|uniref:Peptidase C39-like domain-containing protein n=1 Tax=Streptomyces albus (strain ATCC 21838 / DSM 41398 / FERM P-419 / JCM 4703 / NBRC 107858) TaxID=1081613 RepID=A0A0B5F7C6_STRA4|nr:papain-like cysteine protease family protein [Streptomyces sp. SCSIO ZS0520]AJE86327.1 hypothetical protein SLNWT_5951 [Streptomyces albus]AOU80629.1 hypothetical protein SLNHY_5938 [Streptomyces albus]AYN36339.1 hypothetical protein DUI70_5845 [Streptomyces albus]
MRHRNRTPLRHRRLAALTLAAAALFTVPATTALAAPAPTGQTAPAAAAASNQLGITMQAQEQDNWCWAASGNTIADYYGHDYSQNTFCNAAFGRATDSSCPNSQATLGDVQNAFDWAGINSGSYVSGWLNYATVQSEINADRPVETRIGWTSGGGHMHVIYGFDTASSLVYWGDPWPSSDRYNWASHSWYTSNNSFDWTHSLYRIGA